VGEEEEEEEEEEEGVVVEEEVGVEGEGGEEVITTIPPRRPPLPLEEVVAVAVGPRAAPRTCVPCCVASMGRRTRPTETWSTPPSTLEGGQLSG
jgi:hypothetical protein